MFDNTKKYFTTNGTTFIDSSDDSLTRNWILIRHHVFEPINNPNKNIANKQKLCLHFSYRVCVANSSSHIYFLYYTVQLTKCATQKLHLRNMKLFLIDDRNSSCLTSINYLLDLIMKYLWHYGFWAGFDGKYIGNIRTAYELWSVGELLLSVKVVGPMLWTKNQINH